MTSQEEDAMYKKVLVPTDFSSYAHKIQECLAEIPGIEEIVLLHVLEAGDPINLEKKGWSYGSMIDEARTRLAEQSDHLAHQTGPGISVRTILKAIVEPMSGADGVNMQRIRPEPGLELLDGGSVGEAIVETAIAEEASLICMGAQGKGLLESTLLGSVSTEVLRNGRADLLIFRHGMLQASGDGAAGELCRNIFSKVILTTDFSNAGEEAITTARSLTALRELLLVNVIEREEDFDEAASRMNVLRDELEREVQGVRFTVHVLKGRPADEIVSLAQRQKASLIMMGSQGKSWSRQIRIGSTTFDVAHRALSPILVVRPKKSE